MMMFMYANVCCQAVWYVSYRVIGLQTSSEVLIKELGMVDQHRVVGLSCRF